MIVFTFNPFTSGTPANGVSKAVNGEGVAPTAVLYEDGVVGFVWRISFSTPQPNNLYSLLYSYFKVPTDESQFIIARTENYIDIKADDYVDGLVSFLIVPIS